MARSLYAIGTITKVFGVKGELVVAPFTPPSRFERLKRVFVGTSGTAAAVRDISSVTTGTNGVRLALSGVKDRAEAQTLVGSFVFVEESDLEELPAGSYFVHDLVGLRVVEESGREIGTLRDVLKMPAQDLYVIEKDGREIMVPAVKEFIRMIDVQKGVMTVRLIEGMGSDTEGEER
jgi:16S rRNA processing protein RimM